METGPGPTAAPEHEVRQPDRGEVSRNGEAPGAHRGAYLGFVAHEVRNPLSTALWSAELLARMPATERGGARGEKLSAMCLRSLARVRQLVEDHFLCERLDVAGLPFRPEPLDVRELLEAIVARRPPGSPTIELRIAGLVAVEADRILLERTLDALASLAGREGAPVIVDAATEEAVVRVTFSGHPGTWELLEDPRKGSPGEPRGRALAGPLARRATAALRGALRVEEGAFVLALPAPAYTPRAP